jgi:hypothetical protein
MGNSLTKLTSALESDTCTLAPMRVYTPVYAPSCDGESKRIQRTGARQFTQDLKEVAPPSAMCVPGRVFPSRHHGVVQQGDDDHFIS